MAEPPLFIRALRLRRGVNREAGDEGIILVFWALCLPLLATLLFGVIELGNLVQSADNTQNAADSAALAAAGYLARNDPGSMVKHVIPIACKTGHGKFPSCQCKAKGQDDAINKCASYDWLDNYYIYEGIKWEPIGGPQVSYQAALNKPGWTCGTGEVYQSNYYCTELEVYPPGPTYGLDGSVSSSVTLSEAISATQTAESVQQNYGYRRYTGCTAPQAFFLADQPSGVTCIAYDQVGTIWISIADPVTSPLSPTVTVERSSWAMEVPNGTAVLCSGYPPTGNCN